MRNLIGEAEKSAAGIGEETGVLFMEVPMDSAAAKAGFEKGDVILQVDDHPIDTVNVLIEELTRKSGRSAQITVYGSVQRVVSLVLEGTIVRK